MITLYVHDTISTRHIPGINLSGNRVFAMIYQILLGWKTYKYYCETDELPNPRPTQPKKN